jgi:hypothetical protein
MPVSRGAVPRRIAAWTTMLLVSGSALAQAVPTSWSLELVARSSLDPSIPAFRLPAQSSLSSQPVSLDDSGGVAIRTLLGGAGASEGIFYGTAAAGSVVVSGQSPDPIWSSGLDVRNGRIAVPDGVFAGDGATVFTTAGVLEQRYDPGGPLAVSGIGTVTLTDVGSIVYRADFGFTGDRVVLDEFAGAVRNQTDLANDFTGTYDFLFTPRVNAFGDVVHNSIPLSGPTRRIVRHVAGPTNYITVTVAETGAATGTNWSGFVNSTAIGDDGSVAFTARRASDGIWEVVHQSPDDTRTVIARGDTPDGMGGGVSNSQLGNFPPVTNENGWVAFRGRDLATGSTAVWVGDGDTLVRLVGSDDVLDTDLGPIGAGFDFGGTTGVQTANSSMDINNAGQVAFSCFLENGTIGVFVATPVFSCVADFNDDGTVNIVDVVAFITNWNAQGTGADFNNDGTVNILDVVAFITEWSTGCP